MLETIATGIAGLALAGLGYFIRKAVKNKALASFLSDTLEQILYEKAIQAAEVWGKNMEQKLQQKVEGSQKMQKAVEIVREVADELANSGIKVKFDVDEKTLEQRIQGVFDKIKDRLHTAEE